MNGSASRPSWATMKGTRWAVSPETNATSRESRSSLETSPAHLAGGAGSQCRRELRPPIEGVRPLPGFGLHKFTDDRDPLDLREAPDGRSLRLDPEPGAALLLRGDSQIGDRLPHTNCIPPFAVCMNS